MSDSTKVIDQELVFEANDVALSNIGRADRSTWDQDSYKAALQEAIEVRAFSRWVLGMLGHEILKKWPHLTIQNIIYDLDPPYNEFSVRTMRSYINTYRTFTLDNPGYIPPKHIPWSLLQVVAENKVDGKTPVELLQDLEDEGAITTRGGYKRIKEKQNGIILPPKPNIATVIYEAGQDSYFKFNLSKNTTKESLEIVDFDDFLDQVIDILGKNPFIK